MKLTFATRPSHLARWQTQWVMDALQQAHPGLICEEKVITTRGDRMLDKPPAEIGGKGLFTQELEAELLSGSVDCAVHSLKDLPVENPDGLVIGCIPQRGEVRDAWVCAAEHTLHSLPAGANVGTSSLRRAAQVLACRPDLAIAPLRGNVDTRLFKALEGHLDAIILAGAGLIRLDMQSYVTEWLSLDVMLPAPGQGALAVQCRAEDASLLRLLAVLEDEATCRAVTAERQFLFGLGGGCAVPVGAYADVDRKDPQLKIRMRGLVVSPDGKQLIRVNGSGVDPRLLGEELAQQALSQGAGSLLFTAQPV
ncbi:MAG: hydroxymethylbilane synthase [Chloroflexota bacterium]